MRKTKLQMTMVALMAAMLMSGCGEEPYELTDKEEELIVNYSAHVVTKYNTYQKEGLSYVWPEETEELETEQPEEPMTEENTEQADYEAGTQAPVPGDMEENDATEFVSVPTTLTELFGEPGVEVDYVGARLADSYMESAYYAQYPDPGKQYLILGIDITNTGEEDVALDYLADTAEFRVTLNGEITSSAEITVLTEDFSTFEGTLGAGEIRETVLLFQVPATVVSVDKVDLMVIGDNNYQIILENE